MVSSTPRADLSCTAGVMKKISQRKKEEAIFAYLSGMYKFATLVSQLTFIECSLRARYYAKCFYKPYFV